jgi:hypothetical protein
VVKVKKQRKMKKKAIREEKKRGKNEKTAEKRKIFRRRRKFTEYPSIRQVKYFQNVAKIYNYPIFMIKKFGMYGQNDYICAVI